MIKDRELKNRFSGNNILASTFRERLFSSAKGAKCNSLGQRPRNSRVLILEALKARNEVAASYSRKTSPLVSFRAFSARRFCWVRLLGRCPRLLHFAPLALSNQWHRVPWQVIEPGMLVPFQLLPSRKQSKPFKRFSTAKAECDHRAEATVLIGGSKSSRGWTQINANQIRNQL